MPKKKAKAITTGELNAAYLRIVLNPGRQVCSHPRCQAMLRRLEDIGAIRIGRDGIPQPREYIIMLNRRLNHRHRSIR